MKIISLKKISIYLFFPIFLFLFVIYTYSQIDLNLTISSNITYQKIQNLLIQLGYFQRPLSTIFFILLIAVLFSFYLVILKFVNQRIFSLAQLKKLILAVSLISLLAYPAFSHDLFNYIFDARIITKYHLNPYHYKALDFPDDQWTRFMHWTHRKYPYGPAWLIITTPFSYLGFQKFSITLFLFKLLFFIFFIINCILVYSIAHLVKKENAMMSLAYFALNPLIIIESLISPHNDSIMLTFLLLSILLLIRNQYFKSIIFSLLSVAIKFITAPVFIITLIYSVNKRVRQLLTYKRLILLLLIVYLISLLPVIISREILPWYFIPVLAFFALLSGYRIANVLNVSLSAGLTIKYIFFIYEGAWSVLSYQRFTVMLALVLLLPLFISQIYKKRFVQIHA